MFTINNYLYIGGDFKDAFLTLGNDILRLGAIFPNGWLNDHQLDSTRQVFGQIIATSADVTRNAGLVAEVSQNARNIQVLKIHSNLRGRCTPVPFNMMIVSKLGIFFSQGADYFSDQPFVETVVADSKVDLSDLRLLDFNVAKRLTEGGRDRFFFFVPGGQDGGTLIGAWTGWSMTWGKDPFDINLWDDISYIYIYRYIHPQKLTCPLKDDGWRWCSFWNGPCLGDMLVLGGGINWIQDELKGIFF